MDKQKKIITKQNDPFLLKMATQLLIDLNSLLKANHLYPQKHQILLQITENFYNRLKITSQHKKISIEIFKNNLYIIEQSIDKNNVQAAKEFIKKMQERHIKKIILTNYTAMADIMGLIKLLTTAPQNIAAAGGAKLMLLNIDTQHIQIEEYFIQKPLEENQEILIRLTNSKIFNFFITEDFKQLDSKQTQQLLGLLEKPQLMCELLKIAAHYLIQKDKNTPPREESYLILKILKKINETIFNSEKFKHLDQKTMLQNILAKFDKKTFFNIIFENTDDSIVEYTNSISLLPTLIDPSDTARLVAQKLVSHTPTDNYTNIIKHIQYVIGKLFIDRDKFLNFLPILKENLYLYFNLQESKDIFNTICANFEDGITIENDIELSVGTISEQEKRNVINGLNILKTVPLEKQAITASINKFNLLPDYIYVLQYSICEQTALEPFKKILSKLIFTINQEENNNLKLSKQIIFFLADMLSVERIPALENEYYTSITYAAKKISSNILEKIIIHTITNFNSSTEKESFEHLFKLFIENFTSLCLKIYLNSKQTKNSKILQEILVNRYKNEPIEFSNNLRSEHPKKVMRSIELLKKIQTDKSVFLLYEITFHENIILAQRALEAIANKNSSSTLNILLKTIEHPYCELCISGIKYLSLFKNTIVISKLSIIAKKKHALMHCRKLDLELRCTAIKSLCKLDPILTKNILSEIITKKKLLFIHSEPKRLRLFAKKQLKLLINM
ncbi:MAG: hypothetical protein DRP78_01020 [Candidatus Omnitrophota bacterium]|nr:MAG: hypothetical protein DRP78_01020 [Candidatus Omnitrophota bacterium]